MKKMSALLSLCYSIGQITLGLLIHPYQTMQSLVKDQVFVWMSLLPTGVLAIATVIWKNLVVPLASRAFLCQSGLRAGSVAEALVVHSGQMVRSYGGELATFGCRLLPFFSNWLSFFCIFWQVLLIYLLFRFRRVFNDLDD